MALRANCPACGAEDLFKTGSSVVLVCEFCRSVVARTDRGIEDVGKVADVVESGSPLEVGLRGVYLTVQTQVPSPNALPSFEALQLGQQVWAIPAQSAPVVAEKGTAQMLAAEG